MNCNDLNLNMKFFKRFIKMFNDDINNEFSVNTVNINGTAHFRVKKLELDGDMLIVRTRVNNHLIISACISINDINSIDYIDNSSKVIAIKNIEI